jgi:hypothetical protein
MDVANPGKSEILHTAPSARLIGVIETVLNYVVCKYCTRTSI